MFERLSVEETTRLELLAWRVRNELAAAGLPVVAPGMDPQLVGGAEVTIDRGADAAGGVYVGWSGSPRLRECTSRALRLRRPDDPALLHSARVADAMVRALRTVLSSAGLTVEDANDTYRPRQLRVVSRPDPGAPPVWELREEESASAGRETG
ncbi:hypothetical protein ACIA8F_35805 [Streptomyces sp. NPDC051563]|uniref:hypothetical protein n=1 Tax=Streptomyces sp. NPDC051563 TaxID=3365659 RepID=UPI0037ACB532